MSRALLRAVAGLACATALVAVASPALAAAPTPSPTTHVQVDGDTVTLTTDLATAQRLCARAATAQDRVAGLLARISGDATTQGSVAWLRARAADARHAGHDAQADRLERRADRRAERLTTLQDADDRLAHAAAICAQLPQASS
ncbi:hypothetical protein [Cellulomonas sp.]|uniref:hypothetical protein n=1 Tax=Cellulomonas sp. TaxID=40001 RepID=UPI001B0C2A49|nr:hypothetical protein [Cellulomonas sp.]MBO9553394.1 hypothetical protein [Cellulomonas sp.]